MKVAKNTSNEKMQEHLVNMMERLLDDELFEDAESGKAEIEKAKAMSDLVSASLDIQKVEVSQKNTMLEAIRILGNFGYTLSDVSSLGIDFGNSVKKLECQK